MQVAANLLQDQSLRTFQGCLESKRHRFHLKRLWQLVLQGNITLRFFKWFDLLMRGAFIVLPGTKNAFHCQFRAFSYYFNRQDHCYFMLWTKSDMDTIDEALGVPKIKSGSYTRSLHEKAIWPLVYALTYDDHAALTVWNQCPHNFVRNVVCLSYATN